MIWRWSDFVEQAQSVVAGLGCQVEVVGPVEIGSEKRVVWLYRTVECRMVAVEDLAGSSPRVRKPAAGWQASMMAVYIGAGAAGWAE